VMIKELYFCAKERDLTVIGDVGRLGIQAYKSEDEIDGKVGRIYMDNVFPPDDEYGGNHVTVAGDVGDFILRGNHKNFGEDVMVAGHVSNAIQDNRTRWPLLWDFNTRQRGKIDQLTVY
jgi:hypothetical protein